MNPLGEKIIHKKHAGGTLKYFYLFFKFRFPMYIYIYIYIYGKNCFNCPDTIKFTKFPQVCIFGAVIYDVSRKLTSLVLLLSTVSFQKVGILILLHSTDLFRRIYFLTTTTLHCFSFTGKNK